jgi:hypothetical protein
LRSLLVLAVWLAVLMPAFGQQQPPGEWQLVSMDQWNRPNPPPVPGDGSMGIRMIRFDERGGEGEAHIELIAGRVRAWRSGGGARSAR